MTKKSQPMHPQSVQTQNGVSIPLYTDFASAERATPDELQRQVDYFLDTPPLLQEIMANIPDILTVLNDKR